MNRIVVLIFFLCTTIIFAQKKPSNKVFPFDENTVSALSFRMVGPALTSGRISDLAVDPTNKDHWFIAAASGGVWVTHNHGITFAPIFDNYGSYSIACVEIAPTNSNTIWVGTGENNNQRSVSYGDGVYKSLDGGKSFTNMGLKLSEHIGTIIIDPRDENTVWVAAYGPVWKSGGERGVYKTTDGGKTWKRTLYISEETGIAEIAIDPSNPNILYASAHQRRRHEWTYVGGGPESTLYKSTDGGETWTEINNGLPKGEMGRIGIAVSTVDPNTIYAIVEAKYEKGGVYLSNNKGINWTKQGNFSTSGNYYQEIFCDPVDKNKVFAMDTYLHMSSDGGKNFKPVGETNKHVDNHCIWIDPQNTQHWLVGCDGGLYETYTHASEWKFYANLPITQFYKVTTDNDYPFYNIYGGTQDNNSMGGPSATNNVAGILNSNWYITNGGDGFESATDWSNPNITYAQAQYGWLIRYDKVSGEKVPIQPIPDKNEPAFRWNWDSPLIVSKHNASTIYFAANKLFKSTNRGDEWKTISPDLTRQIDRNKLKVMNQVWSIDAVMKNASTTVYGNIVALDESPLKQGLLYVGTDDGLIQVSEDDGINWTKYASFPGVPENTRVNMLTASKFDSQVVFAVFNPQRQGDFKPYLLKSSDKGKTWFSISGNLPERGNVYCIKQDHINPDLLFAGTEFGAFFTNDGGTHWIKLSGLPTIAVYDLDIQERENDLIAATFGRGFYVLDNYAPLRSLNQEVMNQKAHLFPIKESLLYVQADPLSLEGTGFQGHNMWFAKNPAFGTTFNLLIRDEFKSLKSLRQEKEKLLEKEHKDVFYPSFDSLRLEEKERNPQLIWIISDAAGNEIRRMLSNPSKGINSMIWNFRKNSNTTLNPQANGFLVIPGDYFLSVFLSQNSGIEKLIDHEKFTVKGLNNQTLISKNQPELDQFRNDVAELKRKINNLNGYVDELSKSLNEINQVIVNYPNVDLTLITESRSINLLIENVELLLNGDQLKSKHEFETLPFLNSRIELLEYQLYENTAGVSYMQRKYYQIANDLYLDVRARLELIDKQYLSFVSKLAVYKLPYQKQIGNGWKND